MYSAYLGPQIWNLLNGVNVLKCSSLISISEYFDMLYTHLCDVDAWYLLSPGLGTECA